MSNTNSVALNSVTSIPHASGAAISTADCMFLLQVARKEVADTSLSTAMEDMTSKLKDQQALNELMSSIGGRKDSMGNSFLHADEIALLKRTGFNCDTSGNLMVSDHLRDGKWFDDAILMRANNFAGGGVNDLYVPDAKMKDFKDALQQHITAQSGSNEIQMLQVQRLMNSANEAMQAASSQLKSSHDIAMSIIRNLA